MTATRKAKTGAKGDPANDTTASCKLPLGIPVWESELGRILPRVPPIFRLPPPKARCPYSGLSRTGLLELIAPCERNGFKPPVRAIYRKSHRFAQRGVWQLLADPLFRHLLSVAEHSAEDYMAAVKARVGMREVKENAK